MMLFQIRLCPVNFLLLLLVISFSSCKKHVQSPGQPELPSHSLRMDGDIKLQGVINWDRSGPSLETEIWAENMSSDTAKIEAGPCSFQLLAYRTSGDDRELIWHNQMPEGYICMDELLTYTINPKEEKQLTGFMNISGNTWMHKIPKGEWEFVIRAKTETNDLILIPANRVEVR
ncbi:MAG: hypothetical protein WD008_04075 [Balneolaceae bacterium]